MSKKPEVTRACNAPRARASWSPWTPVIYHRLRDAAYGLDMFLREQVTVNRNLNERASTPTRR